MPSALKSLLPHLCEKIYSCREREGKAASDKRPYDGDDGDLFSAHISLGTAESGMVVIVGDDDDGHRIYIYVYIYIIH